MDAPARRRTDAPDQIEYAQDVDQSIVTCHEPRPGRVVLTERQNADGWLASDLAVALER